MNADIGTLQEIRAQVGDVVEWSGCEPPRQWTIGLISGGNYYESDDHDCPLSGLPRWRIISRANQGPVREVTTRIVPNQCVIGHVEVTKYGKIWMRHVTTADELTAAITTLTQIRDAMADSSAS